jgi:hypothetical protein
MGRLVFRGNDEIIETSLTAGGGALELEMLPPDRSGFTSFLAIGDCTYVYVVESGRASWLGLARRTGRYELTLENPEATIGEFGNGMKIIFSRTLRETRN